MYFEYPPSPEARLTIRGKMIVLGDLKLVGSTQRSENFGGLFVGGSSSTGGWPLNVRTLADLRTADPTTSYFSTTNIIESHCQGINTGSLVFSGTASRIIRWESSTDFFKADIKSIQNTTTQLNYTNLMHTTSYRVYFQECKYGK